MTRVVLRVQNLSVHQDPRVWREARTLRAAGYRVSVVCTVGPNRLPLGIRFVYDQHDHCPELMASKWGGSASIVRLLRLLERLSLRSAHLVLAANDSSRRAAIRRMSLPEAAVVTVRNGADPPGDDGVVAAPAANEDGLRIAFAGRMGSDDGVNLLLAAAAELQRSHPGQIRVDLIGSGEDVPHLRQEASRLGIADLVEWPGWLGAAGLRDRLLLATVGMSPDRANSFTHLSTMTEVSEYLVLGLPVVAADIPENRVTAGDAALYFAAGDASTLAAARASLLDNAEEQAALRARARQRASKVLWTDGAERLTGASRWLLDGGPPILGNQLAEA